MIPFPIESLEGVMCQHDFEGRRIFQHRNSHKWTFYGQNRRISGFLLEEECLDHLRELRRLWDGRINGREPFRTIGKVRLRLGTCDEAVFRSVAGENEYGLPARFSADDVILDVGTHIGSFTRACWERGSRAIHGFEPHPENFRLARHNLRELPGVALRQAAVLHAAMKVIPGEFPEDLLARNTGGVEVIPHREGTTKGLAMDALLRKLGKVLLVKLDCEGSEWPILLHSLEWPRVRALCGEYHARDSHLLCPGLHGPLNARLLRKLLLRHFQFVKITPDHGGGLGKFWASHERGFFPSRT